MAFLVKTDLTPPLYQEIIDEITRTDDTIVVKAINSAVGEMKGYLNRYDTVAMFDNATFEEEYLKTLGKDIACWQLIKMANPNINIDIFRHAYEDAIKFLIKVMKGEADPPWPLRPSNPTDPIDEAGNVEFDSLPKRRNNFFGISNNRNGKSGGNIINN